MASFKEWLENTMPHVIQIPYELYEEIVADTVDVYEPDEYWEDSNNPEKPVYEHYLAAIEHAQISGKVVVLNFNDQDRKYFKQTLYNIETKDWFIVPGKLRNSLRQLYVDLKLAKPYVKSPNRVIMGNPVWFAHKGTSYENNDDE